PITLQGFAFEDLQPWISLLSHRASILLLSINEILLPVNQHPPPHHPAISGSSFSSERSSGTPGFHVFFYSGCPSILPASFIPFMDSLQRSVSSITQFLQEFASNSATSALPRLRSADAQPAPWLLPLTFPIATLILAHL
ncbi:hypothetical protein ILYODFUR_031395, partial [Ilyodon furcidens]